MYLKKYVYYLLLSILGILSLYIPQVLDDYKNTQKQTINQTKKQANPTSDNIQHATPDVPAWEQKKPRNTKSIELKTTRTTNPSRTRTQPEDNIHTQVIPATYDTTNDESVNTSKPKKQDALPRPLPKSRYKAQELNPTKQYPYNPQPHTTPKNRARKNNTPSTSPKKMYPAQPQPSMIPSDRQDKKTPPRSAYPTQPQPTPQPKVSPQPTPPLDPMRHQPVIPQHKHASKWQPAPHPKPIPRIKQKHNHNPKQKLQPVIDPKINPEPESQQPEKVEPQINLEKSDLPHAQPVAYPEPTLEPEPAPGVDPQIEPDPEPQHEPELKDEPEKENTHIENMFARTQPHPQPSPHQMIPHEHIKQKDYTPHTGLPDPYRPHLHSQEPSEDGPAQKANRFLPPRAKTNEKIPIPHLSKVETLKELRHNTPQNPQKITRPTLPLRTPQVTEYSLLQDLNVDNSEKVTPPADSLSEPTQPATVEKGRKSNVTKDPDIAVPDLNAGTIQTTNKSRRPLPQRLEQKVKPTPVPLPSPQLELLPHNTHAEKKFPLQPKATHIVETSKITERQPQSSNPHKTTSQKNTQQKSSLWQRIKKAIQQWAHNTISRITPQKAETLPSKLPQTQHSQPTQVNTLPHTKTPTLNPTKKNIPSTQSRHVSTPTKSTKPHVPKITTAQAPAQSQYSPDTKPQLEMPAQSQRRTKHAPKKSTSTELPTPQPTPKASKANTQPLEITHTDLSTNVPENVPQKPEALPRKTKTKTSDKAPEQPPSLQPEPLPDHAKTEPAKPKAQKITNSQVPAQSQYTADTKPTDLKLEKIPARKVKQTHNKETALTPRKPQTFRSSTAHTSDVQSTQVDTQTETSEQTSASFEVKPSLWQRIKRAVQQWAHNTISRITPQKAETLPSKLPQTQHSQPTQVDTLPHTKTPTLNPTKKNIPSTQSSHVSTPTKSTKPQVPKITTAQVPAQSKYSPDTKPQLEMPAQSQRRTKHAPTTSTSTELPTPQPTPKASKANTQPLEITHTDLSTNVPKNVPQKPEALPRKTKTKTSNKAPEQPPSLQPKPLPDHAKTKPAQQDYQKIIATQPQERSQYGKDTKPNLEMPQQQKERKVKQKQKKEDALTLRKPQAVPSYILTAPESKTITLKDSAFSNTPQQTMKKQAGSKTTSSAPSIATTPHESLPPALQPAPTKKLALMPYQKGAEESQLTIHSKQARQAFAMNNDQIQAIHKTINNILRKIHPDKISQNLDFIESFLPDVSVQTLDTKAIKQLGTDLTQSVLQLKNQLEHPSTQTQTAQLLLTDTPPQPTPRKQTQQPKVPFTHQPVPALPPVKRQQETAINGVAKHTDTQNAQDSNTSNRTIEPQGIQDSTLATQDITPESVIQTALQLSPGLISRLTKQTPQKKLPPKTQEYMKPIDAAIEDDLAQYLTKEQKEALHIAGTNTPHSDEVRQTSQKLSSMRKSSEISDTSMFGLPRIPAFMQEQIYPSRTASDLLPRENILPGMPENTEMGRMPTAGLPYFGGRPSANPQLANISRLFAKALRKVPK